MQNNKVKENEYNLDNKVHDLRQNAVADKIRKNIQACKKKGILICEPESHVFAKTFITCVLFNVPIFLANPNWRQNEWEQVFAQISPALIFGKAPNFLPSCALAFQDLKLFAGYIMIPTGGTGGKIRFAMHTWDSLSNSAMATVNFLGKDKINSLCLLPLYHISGLIQVIRVAITKGKICFEPLESFDKDKNFKGYCVSFVPTQLERFMQISDHVNLLKTFDVVFLGGGPATSTLLSKAREAGIRLSPTYGMTETGSMVTAMDPEVFLDGHSGVGRALSHAEIVTNKNGIISICATSLFSGYFPRHPMKITFWETNDEGFLDEDSYLTVIGRGDRIIITGGEKVDPQEVEEAILATGLVSAVYVVPVPDEKWGQQVVAIYVPCKPGEECFAKIKELIGKTLVNYKIPKSWVMVKELPFDEKGKMTKAVIEKCCGISL